MEERKMERSLTGEKRIYEAPLTPVNIWNDGRGEKKGLEEGGKKEGERWRDQAGDRDKKGKMGSNIQGRMYGTPTNT